MLGNLKKKLSNAIQEGLVLSENLQKQYRQRSTPSTPATPLQSESFSSSLSSPSPSELGIPSDINMAAGCNLLAKYEDDWKAIHDANEENVAKADRVAVQIECMLQRTAAQRIVMTDLITCLACIPTLVTKVQASMDALEQISALSSSVELQIDRLEDLCEECDLHNFMLCKQFELSQYKQTKMANLETYRQSVARKHEQKICQHEDRLRQIQRERQAVFDDAFRGDLEEFKQKGMLPKIHQENSTELALEEIVLEDTETKDALEEFLNG